MSYRRDERNKMKRENEYKIACGRPKGASITKYLVCESKCDCSGCSYLCMVHQKFWYTTKKVSFGRTL